MSNKNTTINWINWTLALSETLRGASDEHALELLGMGAGSRDARGNSNENVIRMPNGRVVSLVYLANRSSPCEIQIADDGVYIAPQLAFAKFSDASTKAAVAIVEKGHLAETLQELADKDRHAARAETRAHDALVRGWERE